MHAGEDFREGGFAGAVLTEERMDLAALQIEVDVAQHFHTRELLGYAARRNERRIGGGRGCLGHAQRPAGTGEAGSISFCALRSDQKAAGMGASTEATFWVTSLALAAPGITETTIGCASTNCSAAAGRPTLWALQIASMPRTLAWTSGEALP